MYSARRRLYKLYAFNTKKEIQVDTNLNRAFGKINNNELKLYSK